MSFLVATSASLAKNRSFVQLLNYYFNKVDHNRLQQIGPDRTCAEWLMRNGAFIRWQNCRDFVAHYKDLPLDENDKRVLLIEEVLADNASVTHHGFTHFRGCSCITTMTFRKCPYFDDKCIPLLNCAENLKHLTISDCPNLTCQGVMQLAGFKNLQNLTIGKSNHYAGKTLEEIVHSLQASMPNCRVYSDTCSLNHK